MSDSPDTPPPGENPDNPEIAPALALWVQLATRITTLPLHYRSGNEESAAVSVFDLFPLTRKLVVEHPKASKFREIAIKLLSEEIRPYSDRWHGWMSEVEGTKELDGRQTLRFRDELARHTFRNELSQLRNIHLIPAKLKLAALARIIETDVTKEVKIKSEEDKKAESLRILGKPIKAGIQEISTVRTKNKGEENELVDVDSINLREHSTIISRRKILETADYSPEALNNATGLALSGGGIRSATFCLGIVQTLAKKKLLSGFDYLSTVSGGGYFGAFLSCALGTLDTDDDSKEPLKGAATKAEIEARIDQVFLGCPSQSEDEGSVPLNPSCSTSKKASPVESYLLRHLRNNSRFLLGGGRMAKAMIAGLLASGVLWNLLLALPIPLASSLIVVWLGPVLWNVQPDIGISPIVALLILLGAILSLLLFILPGIQKFAHGNPPASKSVKRRDFWQKATLGVGGATLAAGVIYILPALFIANEALRQAIEDLFSVKATQQVPTSFIPASLSGIASLIFAALAKWLSPHWPRLRSLAVKLFILSGPLFFLLVFLMIGNNLGLNKEETAPWKWEWVLGVTVALSLWSLLTVNINTLAPHRYYRNRLCDCYLARSLRGDIKSHQIEKLKQMPLTKLGQDATAPYHLINMTVNVPNSEDPNLRGRASDFFFASRDYCGSPITGYIPTEKLQIADPHFDLGTAIAISGAAASTSMGFKTLPHLRFLMALLNIRLGYWLFNPALKLRSRIRNGAGPTYLLKEMFGKMHENDHFINLSDGGHIENLAAYELLRRHCKFIVCVDGGQEDGMECADLVRLERYAKIDLGIKMHFDIDDLKVCDDSMSKAHAIIVKINYTPEIKIGDPKCELGWMIYLKLAMTGGESTFIKDYKRQNPNFPHESTGDQIYSEEQFEAYRELGECAIESLFREELIDDGNPATLESWFTQLAKKLLPDNDPVFKNN